MIPYTEAMARLAKCRALQSEFLTMSVSSEIVDAVLAGPDREDDRSPDEDAA